MFPKKKKKKKKTVAIHFRVTAVVVFFVTRFFYFLIQKKIHNIVVCTFFPHPVDSSPWTPTNCVTPMEMDGSPAAIHARALLNTAPVLARPPTNK